MTRPAFPLSAVLAFLVVAASFSALTVGCGSGGGNSSSKVASASTLDVTYYYLPG